MHTHSEGWDKGLKRGEDGENGGEEREDTLSDTHTLRQSKHMCGDTH